MTKAELSTLLRGFAPDLKSDRLAAFNEAITNIEKDYDTASLTATNFETLKTKHTELEKANAELKDTTLRLFMSSSVTTEPKTEENPTTKRDEKDPTVLTTNELLNTILGVTTETTTTSKED